MTDQSSGFAGSTVFIDFEPPVQKQEEQVHKASVTYTTERLTKRTFVGGLSLLVHGTQKVCSYIVAPFFSHKRKQLANQQAVAEAQRKVRARASAIQQLRHLSDKVPTLTVAFIGIKGGAATTTTMVHASSVMADITRSSLLASDFNPASGTAGLRLGKDYGDTLTVREFSLIVNDIKSRRDISPKLRPTQNGVQVLSGNDLTVESSEIFGTDTTKMLDEVRQYFDYHYIDTANDITTASSIAIIKAADVLVFTANAAVKDSLLQLNTSMQTVAAKGFLGKVSTSIALISNLPSGGLLQDYRKYLNRINLHDEIVKRFNYDIRFMMVPHDSVIAQDSEVDLASLDWATYQAYLELNIAILEQANTARVFSPMPLPLPRKEN